jgi:DNA repair protein RadC
MSHLTIHELPHFNRPREKLTNLGLKELSTPELISLILGTGTKTENALTLAKKITRSFCSLTELAKADANDLIKLKGVGMARASQLIACFELGRRIHTNQVSKQLLAPEDVLPIIDDMRSAGREHLVAIYLNARHEFLAKHLIAVGGLNQAVIEPRDILSEALKLPCSAVILAHNHPSGDAQPSDEDIKMTQRIAEACDLLGLELIDHLVVTGTSFVSLRQIGF